MNHKNMAEITKEDLFEAFPEKKATITDEIVEVFNRSVQEPEFQGESLLQTAITYQNVMARNQVGIKDYLRAIRFCAYLISMDDNFTEAYKRTFGDRKFVKERMNLPRDSIRYNELTSAASRYRRSKLVTAILTLSQVPLDLMFTGARYKAIGVLAGIMETSKYDRDRINAAKELLAATKGPENVKMELEVGPSADAVKQQNKLFEQLADISAAQHKRLLRGEDVKSVQKIGIQTEFVEAEVE